MTIGDETDDGGRGRLYIILVGYEYADVRSKSEPVEGGDHNSSSAEIAKTSRRHLDTSRVYRNAEPSTAIVMPRDKVSSSLGLKVVPFSVRRQAKRVLR